jgi:hypothetical protein
MKPKNTSIQPDLFEQDEPRVLPALSQKEHLAKHPINEVIPTKDAP